MTERAMFEKVAFTMYPVREPMRARAFYGETLGLTMGLHSPDGVWTEYDLPGGGCLALFATKDLVPSASGACVALEVADLDALVLRLERDGVRFKARDIVSPVCRMTIILDTEDNAIILHELERKRAAHAHA